MTKNLPGRDYMIKIFLGMQTKRLGYLKIKVSLK